MSFTPGPWRVYPPGHCVPYYDVCDRIVSDNPSGRSANDGPSDADAALIAAAPDLLESLEELVLDAIGRGVTGGPLIRKAQAAVRKARGEG